MPNWEERVKTTSHPSLQLEHEVRYRAAAPIIARSDRWCDLGCGSGAAAAALGRFEGRAILVDIDEAALRQAESHISARETTTLVADLTSESDIDRVRGAALPAKAGVVTCFEVVEHLAHFRPLVELLVELATSFGYTAVLSVPNDAFWSTENPYHQSMWGESAFAELGSLLPEGHVTAHQVLLTGSAIARAAPQQLELSAEVLAERVPTNLLVAFGPRAADLGSPAAVRVGDLEATRQWERQREADLAYYQALARSRAQ